MRKVLSIAGSDPSGGAGIQQDLKVFNELGVYGLSVVSAVTSQNTRGVDDAFVLRPEVVLSQLSSVFGDLKLDAVKVGMLGSAENVSAVCKFLKKKKVVNLVVDPVIWSSSGFRLLAEGAIVAMRAISEIAAVTTPNVREAEVLADMIIKSEKDKRIAAEKIGDCVITGGDSDATDLLYYKGEFLEFPGLKLDYNVHGTGCMFSSAIAAYLAYGLEVPDAVKRGKDYVTEKIRNSEAFGGGVRLAVGSKDDSITSEIKAAINKFVSHKNAFRFAPEVGINVVYALPGASSVNDVYGLAGRIIKVGETLVPVGEIKKGGSSHVARVVLSALNYDQKKRAAMNMRYSRGAVEACLTLGLKVSSFDRKKQPKDTSTMEWGTIKAITEKGFVPNVIYDKGSVGKEAMIRVLGETPTEVVDTSLRIIERLSEKTSP